MDISTHVFSENEREANGYTASGLFWSAIVVVLTWILTFLRVFVTDITIMSVAGTLALIFLLLPCVVQRLWAPTQVYWKYVMILAFIFGIAVLSSALSMHLIPAWACPILVACHYYSPRFTRHTFLLVHVAMLLSFLCSIHIGVWDSNLFMSAEQVSGFATRLAYIQELSTEGFNVYQRALILFYLPRAAIISVVYLVSTALSKRTNHLILRNRTIEREHQALETELNVATAIQASMLPSVFPAFPTRPEFEIYATMNPAKEVGGDFYDFFLVDDDHLAMVIADVSGKGVPAALFMVISKTLIKNAIQLGFGPKEVLERVSNQLCEGNESQMFVTVWLGIYQISTGKLVEANAGHEHPAVQRANGEFTLRRNKHGLVLAGMENLRYQEHELQLNIGDTLYVYTDGVPEAINEEKQFFGTERMLDSLNQRRGESLVDLLLGVGRDVGAFAGKALQYDDITMLALRRNGNTDAEKTKMPIGD